jgi:hypothetical protein
MTRMTAGERRLLPQLSLRGPTFQTTLPGLYAWGTTVAPPAWSQSSPLVPKIAAVIGAVALVLPIVTAQSKSVVLARHRIVSMWSFVFASLAVWASVPSPPRFDVRSGTIGLVAWALYAFGAAGPSLGDIARAPEVEVSAHKRSAARRTEGVFVGLGMVFAFGLQSVGWGESSIERTILIRLVALLSGVAVLAATTDLALARYVSGTPSEPRRRLSRAFPWLVVAVGLLCAWVVFTFR